MRKLLPWLFLAAFVFCLTYNPQNASPTIGPAPGVGASGNGVATSCCNNNQYMANNSVQCKNAHYRGVHFGNPQYGCPERHPMAHQGAIIGL